MRTRLIAVLICLIPLAVHAQQEAPNPIVEQLSFPGGTLSEYVVVLREAVAPDPVNIIIRGSAGEIEVPEIILQQVGVGTAIEIALPDPFEEHIAFDDDGEMYKIEQSFNTHGYGDAGALVFVIEQQVRLPIEQADGKGQQHRLRLQLEVFALSELVALTQAGGIDIDIDTIVDAVETALDTGGGDSADLRYHEDSTLLIVRGTGDEVHAVQQVLRQFYDIAGSAAQQERARRVLTVAEQIAMIEFERESIRGDVEIMQQTLRDARNSRPIYSDTDEDEFEAEKRQWLDELDAKYRPLHARYVSLESEISKLDAMLDMLRDTEAFNDASALSATAEFATKDGETR